MGASHLRSAVVAKNFADITDHTRANRFDRLANAIAGMTLVAHLRDHLVAIAGFEESSRLPDVVCERLLRVDMNAALHGRKRSCEMRVVRRRDDHGIDLLVHLVEHHAKVVKERLRRAPVLHVFCAMVSIYIAERHEVFLAAALFVRLLGNPSARADEGDIEFAVRGLPSLSDGECWKYRASS